MTSVDCSRWCQLGLATALRARDEARRLQSLGWERHDAGTQYLWPGAAWGARQGRRHGIGGVKSGAAKSDMDTRRRKKKATDRRDPTDSGIGHRREERRRSGCWAGQWDGPQGKELGHVEE